MDPTNSSKTLAITWYNVSNTMFDLYNHYEGQLFKESSGINKIQCQQYKFGV